MPGSTLLSRPIRLTLPMTIIQILAGALFIILGLFGLVQPSVFGKRPVPKIFPIGIILVGISSILSVANSMVLVVLSVVAAIAGIVMVVVGLVQSRRRSQGTTGM